MQIHEFQSLSVIRKERIPVKKLCQVAQKFQSNIFVN